MTRLELPNSESMAEWLKRMNLVTNPEAWQPGKPWPKNIIVCTNSQPPDRCADEFAERNHLSATE